MAALTHDRDFAAPYGVIETVAPGIRRVVARNPSPFTFKGTATFILGEGSVAVIDPGPDDAAHIAALLDGLAGEEITHLLVTHTHLDHSPACRAVKAASGAETYGFGEHGAGRFERDATVEAGGDADFRPDHTAADGEIIAGEGWSVECVHTPGHTSNHLCFADRESKVLFTGDHVMGWSTSVISPPDGDMKDYVESLEKLLGRDDETYMPTHGAAIANPQVYVRALIDHRRRREEQILDCLNQGVGRINDMVPIIYPGLDERLTAAAGRSTFAAMIKMTEEGRIACAGALAMDAEFSGGK